MSASPLDSEPNEEAIVHDAVALFAPLSAGESGTTVTLDPHFVGEDHNNSSIDLLSEFDLAGMDVEFELLDIANESLFDEAHIEDGILVLDYAPDQVGQSEITIRASVDQEQLLGSISVNVLPVNDRPTTTGFSDIFVTSNSPSTSIDLFAAFADVEDADDELTYTVTGISNPDLFSSMAIDKQLGHLVLTYAADAAGSSEITVRATDRDGLFVEMSTDGSEFQIYDDLHGTEGVDKPLGLNLSPIQRLTDFAFFEYNNGTYDYESFDEQKFISVLHNQVTADGGPLVLNIENDLYDNSPEGRERLAEVLAVLERERPDLQNYGFYRLLPESNWHAPVKWHRAQEDAAQNVRTGFSRPDRYEQYENSFNAWTARNELFRTEEVGDALDGTIADHITLVNPSLYTWYRNGYYSTDSALMFEAVPDLASDSLAMTDVTLADGMQLYLRAGIGSSLPGGLDDLVNYFVVNYDGTSFQLSETLDGSPIAFSSQGSGGVFINVQNEYLELDPSVRYWEAYAEANVAEAERFGVDVIPYVSPSFKGIGEDFIDKNFFRFQLDTLHDLGVDGITLFNLAGPDGKLLENQGWWEALSEFRDYLDTPTQFSVTVAPTVQTSPIPDLIVPTWQPFHSIGLAHHFNDQIDLNFAVTNIEDHSIFDDISQNPDSGELSMSFSQSSWGSSAITVLVSGPNGESISDTFTVNYARIFAPLNARLAATESVDRHHDSLYAAAVAYHDIDRYNRARNSVEDESDQSISEERFYNPSQAGLESITNVELSI